MRQQINLYQDVLIDKPEPLQSGQAWLVVALVSLCCGLLGGYSYWSMNSIASQRDSLVAQLEVEEQRITELELKYPEVEKNVLLEEKIRRLEREIEGRRQALAYFSSQDGATNLTMLASLEGLARTPLDGVWLRKVRLFNRGEEVQLSGHSVAPELVPDYLSLLSEEHVFGGQIFSRFQLDRSRDKNGQIRFALETGGEDAL